MRIFLIPTWHPTQTRPHYCRWIIPHIEAAHRTGHQLCVLHVDMQAPHNTKRPGVPIWENDHHLYLPLPTKLHRWTRTKWGYKRFLREYVNGLQQLYSIAREAFGVPDLLHAHVSLPAGHGAAMLGHKEHIPTIVTEHYSGFLSDMRFPWRLRTYINTMCQHIQGLYCVSPGQAQRIQKTGHIEVTGILPNPIDTHFFSANRDETQKETFRMVTTGDMGHVKGTDLLFRALSQLPLSVPWQLTLFGNIRHEPPFDVWLQHPTFQERIQLPGRVPQTQLQKAYQESDLFIVSSRHETANVSMLEAMSCGVPVVSTRCGAPETLLEGSGALTVPVADPAALANAIIHMSKKNNRPSPQSTGGP